MGAQVDWQQYNQLWHNLWQAGLRPGQHFDKGGCSPKLLQLLHSGDLQVQGKRVLVPGCGRGYDVFAFAQAGAQLAVGLELLQAAVAAASSERDRQLQLQLHQQKQQQEAQTLTQATDWVSRCELVVGDFYAYNHPSGPFDVGYDYTFLCAMHPSMRKDWAQGWARQLAPAGELITLIYPVDPSMDQNNGPPWPLMPDLYKELLLPAGFELLLLQQIPASFSHESRAGREWLGRWRRKAEQ